MSAGGVSVAEDIDGQIDGSRRGKQLSQTSRSFAKSVPRLQGRGVEIDRLELARTVEALDDLALLREHEAAVGLTVADLGEAAPASKVVRIAFVAVRLLRVLPMPFRAVPSAPPSALDDAQAK